ncbi:hypothetical protein V8E53_001055 [Lactarius tabidus]
MHDIFKLVKPPGCRLTAIFDSCHSGSALDLSYIYSTKGKTKGKIKEPNLALEAGQGLMSTASSYAREPGVVKAATTGRGVEQRARPSQTKTSPADVVTCRYRGANARIYRQVADAVENGTATGAMSYFNNLSRAELSAAPPVDSAITDLFPYMENADSALREDSVPDHRDVAYTLLGHIPGVGPDLSRF